MRLYTHTHTHSLEETRGITLISLVITIIVLLILAGIIIATLSGQNGILTRTSEAKKNTEIADIKEQIQIKIMKEQSLNNGEISDESLKDILEIYGILSQEEKLINKTLTTKKGNYEIKVSDIWNGTVTSTQGKEPEIITGANAPNIERFNKENTYYVVWNINETKTEYIADEKNMKENEKPSNWCDYTSGVNHWANVKTTGGGNECYWVWIPRYAYKITEGYHSNTAGTIDIKFLRGKTNSPIDGTNIEIKNATGSGNWNIHPAFTNEGNGGFGELEGIWVAKFEASSNSPQVVENPTVSQLATDGGSAIDTDLKIRVRPNVTGWRGITLGNIFTVCRNLTVAGNSLENTSNMDSHLMKNTEWGAVAYLSRSIYGKNSEVWNNPYYNNTTNASSITGLCGKGANDRDLVTTNINATCKYNDINGGNASTTGNVYGVYDMAGGEWEYVAGILSNYKSVNGNYDFSNVETYPNKYFDWYTGNSSDSLTNYNANNGKYGEAVYETSISGDTNTGSWDNKDARFFSSVYPVILRGGHVIGGNKSGIFAFGPNKGEVHNAYGFRPVVIINPQ